MASKVNVKRANTESEYTAQQVLELQKCAEDPIYFIENYVKIQHPTRGAVPFVMYDYQKEMIRTYEDNRYVVVLSARQTGKALALDTRIPTPTGWTTMGEIVPGDFVLGADGRPVEVEAVSDIMENHVCYQVQFDTGDAVIADGEHLWEVRDEYVGTTKVLTTQQMVDVNYTNAKNQARFTVKTTKPLELEHADLKIDPYVLGVWLGDGTARTGQITLHEDDASQILSFAEEHYDINNVLQNKHIPMEYKRASYDQRLSLLQGLMDTDGTVDGKGRDQCGITLSDETLSKDVYELVSSLGLKPSYKTREVNGKVQYEVKFSAYRSEIQVFRNQRKLDAMKDTPHPTRIHSTKKRSIQSITQVASVPVRCIRVKNDDHLFLFGDGFIPTHNSITSGAYLLWFAMFKEDKLVLIASNKNSNAMEMVYRIRYAYENLPEWLKPGVEDDGWNKHNIGFDNGSRIVSTATSEDSGRGLAISLLFLDEFAFVAPAIQDEFWTSIAPTLSTGGSCIMTSTPNGDSNIFAQVWRGAQLQSNGFAYCHVRWDQPPGRDEKFKREEIGRIGQRRWDQEYACEFLSSDAMLIDSLFLAQLTSTMGKNEPIFKIKEFEFFEEIKHGQTYLVGVDPSTGSGEDFSVITIYSFPELKQIAEFRSNSMSPTLVYNELKNILLELESKDCVVYFSIENNGVGEALISLYEADDTAPPDATLVSEEGANRVGMTTTSRTKMSACITFKELLESGKMSISSPVLLAELKSFTRHRGSYAAQIGATDDCVSATLIITRLVEEIAAYEQAAYDKLYNGEFERWNRSDYDGYDGEIDEDDEAMPMII